MRRLRFTLPLLAIIAVGIICYGNSFNVPFLLDDVVTITGNPLVTSFSFTFKPRILGDLSFALNYRLHGFALPGYHAVNLLLHLANGLLLYRLLQVTLTTPLFRDEGGTAPSLLPLQFPLVSALIFVAHPLQTQAVTYLTQRVALLAAFFFLASLLAYGGARLADSLARAIPLFLISLLFACAALLSKENAVTLAAVLLLYEATFFRGALGRRLLPLLLYLLPIICGLMVIMGRSASLLSLPAELAAHSAESGAPPRLAYLLTQFPVVVGYLRLFLLPHGQNLDHDVPLRDSLADPVVLASLLLIAAIASLGGYLWGRSRRGGVHAAACGVSGFAVGWLFLTLVVESGLIPLRDFMSEQRFYLPSVGLAILSPLGLRFLAGSSGCGDSVRATRRYGVLVTTVVLLLGVTTLQRNRVWQSEVSVWEDAVAKSPDKGRPHGSLAHALQRAGRLDEAERQYKEALRLSPGDHVARNNLGALYLVQKRYAEALGEFAAALPTAPDRFKLFYNMGMAYAGVGRLRDAESQYRQALKLHGSADRVQNNLGIVLAGQGKLGEAAAAFREAVRLNPENREAAANLVAIGGGGR